MDGRNEELFGDMLDVRFVERNLETKVGQKGKTLFSERENNV
jgi:hypothetical protein